MCGPYSYVFFPMCTPPASPPTWSAASRSRTRRPRFARRTPAARPAHPPPSTAMGGASSSLDTKLSQRGEDPIEVLRPEPRMEGKVQSLLVEPLAVRHADGRLV